MKTLLVIIVMFIVSGCAANKVAIEKNTCECNGNICVCDEAE